MKMVNCIRLLAALVTFLSLNGALLAQEECGTDQIIARNPFLQQLYAERVDCAPEVDLDTAQVLTIPVVFHVVHLGEAVGEGTNISDEQLLSCIDNLNHRFRGDTEALAALTDEYDEYELSLVKDSKIEFCLAVRDPEGNPTSGINRIDGTGITYDGESYADDGIAMTSTNSGIAETHLKSEVGCWDVDKYINFYVVSEINGNNGGNGIQGYAYLGPTNNCLDGLVCLYNVVGTEGNLKSTHNLNTTVTHEMGHHLSLFHTFWASLNCTPETNPCTQGDLCPDTPKTTANSSCNTPDCPGAMLENYMDYTPQSCRTAFSQNQIERMRDAIWSDRSGYVFNNLACQPVDGIDVAISSVTLPSFWCQPTVDFSVKITNFGGQDVNGAELSVNGAIYPLPSLSAGEFTTVDFQNYNVGNGLFEFELIYPEDQYPSNNTYSHTVAQSGVWTEIILTTDIWFSETSWELTDESGEVVMSGANYNAFASFVEGQCLSEGCYTFTINDAAGDGMNFPINGVGGTYEIIVNGETVVFYQNGSDQWSTRTEEFCVESTCPLLEDLCPWDINNDNRVNSEDLLYLLTLNGQEVPYCTPGDFNLDGIINQDDLNELTAHYGLICAEGEIQTKDLTVDENKGVYLVGGSPNYYNVLGQKVSNTGDLAPGIYLVVEKWSDGKITTKKIFINSWNPLIEN